MFGETVLEDSLRELGDHGTKAREDVCNNAWLVVCLAPKM